MTRINMLNNPSSFVMIPTTRKTPMVTVQLRKLYAPNRTPRLILKKVVYVWQPNPDSADRF